MDVMSFYYNKVIGMNIMNFYYNKRYLRMSKQFKLLGPDEDDYWSCVGSPADIRKAIKILEFWTGAGPLYVDKPVMREGRLYELTLDPTETYWTVSRAA